MKNRSGGKKRRVVLFGLWDTPLVQVEAATHVVELGQGQVHVVLHTNLVEVDRFRTCSQILKPYSYAYNSTVTNIPPGNAIIHSSLFSYKPR